MTVICFATKTTVHTDAPRSAEVLNELPLDAFMTGIELEILRQYELESEALIDKMEDHFQAVAEREQFPRGRYEVPFSDDVHHYNGIPY